MLDCLPVGSLRGFGWGFGGVCGFRALGLA